MSELVMVTGAHGFVGRSLCSSLANQGLGVRPVVRVRSAGEMDQVPVGCIGPETDWAPALAGVDVVMHCAARVHVMNEDAASSFEAFRRVNVVGTLNLARQAAAIGVKRFVFVSSVKVNGEATLLGRPFRADDKPNPQDAYGASKYEAELGLRRLGMVTGMEVVIVRPPLVYGPGVKANFAAMMRWLARGVPLPFGSVSDNQRSFVALDNLVSLLATCVHHPAAANQTFLVSDGCDLSTCSLLRRMGNAMGKSTYLLPVPPAIMQLVANMLGKGDVARRLLGSLQVDIGKTRELLGWEPPISVDEGLRRAAEGGGSEAMF